jgi:flagellar biosynthesis/type III secretory pathway protein FliH
MLPQGYEFQSEPLRRSFAEGRTRGLTEGKAEGEAKGKAEGEAKGKAESVLEVLDARSIPVTVEQRTHILETSDNELLRRWLRRVAQVSSAQELFAD